MTVCVFTGPTLSARDASAVLSATYLPPVQQGDVYRAAVRHGPRAIGIVDGYFQQVPSVWHKEILWAMARGIHVFGSASMGALRAAELWTFGMRGVGRIFEAFRDGRLAPYEGEVFEDDDEVALLHGPSERDFVALSEAMVNIRCTLAAAADAGVITTATRGALVRLGKTLFYPDRTYDWLLRCATEDGLPAAEVSALRAWLPDGRVDQKRADALAMLAAMREFLADDPPPARAHYVFEPSEMWERAAVSALPPELGSAAEAPGLPHDALLDELRLDGLAYVRARQAGLLRMVALHECERERLAPDAEARRAADAALRRRLGIVGREATERWCADNDLTAAGFARLIDDEARLGQLEALAGSRAEAHLVDHLRAAGDYGRYAARARAKERALAESGLEPAHVDEWTKLRLTTWYFERHLDAPVPDDIPAYAVAVGFPNLDAFYRAVLREYLYLRRAEGPGAAPGAVQDARSETTGEG